MDTELSGNKIITADCGGEGMMGFNYRVIEFTEPDGKKVRAIHEVFYTNYPTAKILTGYSENPAVVLDDSDDPTVMFKILVRMSQALLRDVIPVDFFDKEAPC